MNDLTLLYYTANRIDREFATLVREGLDRVAAPYGCGPEIVCVSQADKHQDPWPIEEDFHHLTVRRTIRVSLVEPSIWQVYQNILTGAKAATTPFIACCEDDTVYAPSHFTYRPPLDTFAYDRNRWVITKRLHPQTGEMETIFYWRERHQMAMCIAPRALLIETLEEKFAKYPVSPPSTDIAKKQGWGEPGRYEKNLHLTPRKMEYFDSPEPSVTFNHEKSLMGRRQWKDTDTIVYDLPPWGNAADLWSRIHG